jgi:chromosomal replication initiation ATPase DnaA
VDPIIPIDYDGHTLTLRAVNKDSRRWLKERMTSTATRLLQGIANQNLTIQFVVREEVQA